MLFRATWNGLSGFRGTRPRTAATLNITLRCEPDNVKGAGRMTRQKAGVWLFAAASVLSFIAALIPVLKGEGPNGVFLGSGTVFLAIAVASARRGRVRDNGPASG